MPEAIRTPGQKPAVCGSCRQPIGGMQPMFTPLPGELVSLTFLCGECGAIFSVQVAPRAWFPAEINEILRAMDAQTAAAAGSAVAKPDADQINPHLRDVMAKLHGRPKPQ